MNRSSTSKSARPTSFTSVHDRVIDFRRKLQVLREHDQSHSEYSPAVPPMRFVTRLHPKHWRRRELDGKTVNPVAGVLFGWFIYLALGGAIIAIALHYAAGH